MAINEIASQLFIVQSPHDSIVQHRISRVVHVVAHSTRYPRAVHVHWCLSPPNAKSSSAHSPGGDLDTGSRRWPHKLLLLKRYTASIISNEDHVTVLPSMVEMFLTEVRRETLASKWIPKLKAWNMKTELNDVHNKEFYRFESTAVDPYHLNGSLFGYYWPILWMYWLNFDNSFSWTSVFRYQFR